MNDQVAVVEQNPLARPIAFGGAGPFADRREFLFDLVGDGLILTAIRTRRDDEVVGEGGDTAQVENGNLSRFLGFGCPNRRQPGGRIRNLGGEVLNLGADTHSVLQ